MSLEYAADFREGRCENRRASPREDIYSLGVSFYEVLTGARPTRTPLGAPLEDLLEEIITRHPPHPRDLHPDIEVLGLLGDVALTWMHKEPMRRPRMGLEAVKMLSEAIVEAGDALDIPLPPRLGDNKVVLIRAPLRVVPVNPPPKASPMPTAARTPQPVVPPAAAAGQAPASRSTGLFLAAAVFVLSLGLLLSILKDSRLLSPSSALPVSPVSGQRNANEPAQAKDSDTPPAPAPDQKRPPCDPQYQVEMGGACWQPSDSRLCSNNAFRKNGVCYVPVRPGHHPRANEP